MNTNKGNNIEYQENAANYTEGSISENTITKKENVLFGVIGALLGSLIGVALWIVIYNLGYFASISGIVMIVCGIKGYELFAGSLSKKGIIINIIISIIMVYVAMHLAASLAIYDLYKNDYYITIFDCIRSVPDFIAQSEDIKDSFLKDLAFGYIFTLGGAFSSVRHMLSEHK